MDKWAAIKAEKACKICSSKTIHQVLPVLYLQREGSPITLNQFTNCHFVQRGKEKNDFIFQTTEFLHALHPSSFFLSLRGGDGGMERESWIRVRTCKSRQKKLEETCDHQELAVTCALWRHSWRVAMTPPPSFANTPVWAPFTLKCWRMCFGANTFLQSVLHSYGYIFTTILLSVYIFSRFVKFLAKNFF